MVKIIKCCQSYYTVRDYKKHLQSKKHARGGFIRPSKDGYCPACDVKMNKESIYAHLKSKYHNENVKNNKLESQDNCKLIIVDA